MALITSGWQIKQAHEADINVISWNPLVRSQTRLLLLLFGVGVGVGGDGGGGWPESPRETHRRQVNYLLASGGDDSAFRIWDLRAVRPTGEVITVTVLEGSPYSRIPAAAVS